VDFLLKKNSNLPGFSLTLGYTVLYLSLIVLLPLSTLFLKSATLSPAEFWGVVTSPRTIAAYRLTFGAAFAAAAVNVVFGFVIAWVLARYDFPFKRIVDALIDLPFALPTAVAGIALTAIYSPNGWLGRFLVRTVQPVLEDLDPEIEEAAASLGADRWQAFRRVILPALLPPLVTGFALAFARATGEYGSVIFIAGNMPGSTEVAPLLIMTKLEQYDYAGATAIALVMLTASFALLWVINGFQRLTLRRIGAD
jgi:sulfate transport system permease protein